MDRLTEQERLGLQLQAAHRDCLREDARHRTEIHNSLVRFDRSGGREQWIAFVNMNREKRTA